MSYDKRKIIDCCSDESDVFTASDVLEGLRDILSNVNLPTEPLLPSDFAEKYISLDSSVSGQQGPLSYYYTPYWRECADFYHPSRAGKIQVIAKCAQSGGSQCVAVPVAVWTVAQSPCNMMVTSANDYLSEKFVSTRFDPACASAGIMNKFRPAVIRARNAKTGNTSAHKEFGGGNLFFRSVGSVDSIGKQIMLKRGFFDDWSSAEVADGQQGNLFNLLQLRFNTNAYTQKQTYCSTPELSPDPTFLLYERSDKQLWHVPCPCCKQKIPLEIEATMQNGDRAGLIYDTDKQGVYIAGTARYKCQKCGGVWQESQKFKAIREGEWLATCTPIDPEIIGRRLNSLYAPPWADGWEVLAKERAAIYEGTKPDIDKLKVFRNLREALPFAAEEAGSNTFDLQSHIGDYEPGEVPDVYAQEVGAGEIVAITIGVDLGGVQDDARLDYEVVAWTTNWQSFSIMEGEIGTYTSDRLIKNNEHRKRWSYSLGVENSVWPELVRLINNRWPLQSGIGSMKAIMTFVDYGYKGDEVAIFCQSGSVVAAPAKGDGRDLYSMIKDTEQRYFKRSVGVAGLITVCSNVNKARVHKDFGAVWREGVMPAHYCCFPRPLYGKYNGSFFAQMESEEAKVEADRKGKAKGFYFKLKSGHQNHKFDARCLARAAMQYTADNVAKKINATMEEFYYSLC